MNLLKKLFNHHRHADGKTGVSNSHISDAHDELLTHLPLSNTSLPHGEDYQTKQIHPVAQNRAAHGSGLQTDSLKPFPLATKSSLAKQYRAQLAELERAIRENPALHFGFRFRPVPGCSDCSYDDSWFKKMNGIIATAEQEAGWSTESIG